MSIELTIIISVLSLSFAVYSGLKSIKRNEKHDTAEEAKNEAVVITKLENIQTNVIELKTEMKGYKEDVQHVRELAIRDEESLKSLHKRVNKLEEIILPAHVKELIE